MKKKALILMSCFALAMSVAVAQTPAKGTATCPKGKTECAKPCSDGKKCDTVCTKGGKGKQACTKGAGDKSCPTNCPTQGAKK